MRIGWMCHFPVLCIIHSILVKINFFDKDINNSNVRTKIQNCFHFSAKYLIRITKSLAP